MAGNLTDEQRKWILKQYWKTENCERVRERWLETFSTPPPTRLTIYRLRDKFERTGSIHNTPRSGRPVTVTTPENQFKVSQAFLQCPQKSKHRASSELGIERRSLGRMMNRVGLKMFTPPLMHGPLEDVRDNRLEFSEKILDQEHQGMTSQKVAAGLIVYRRLHSQIEFLLLQHCYGDKHWTPPKGHVDPGESEFQTALRETREEAGLDKSQMTIDETFREEIFYPVKSVPKRVVYWLSQVADPNVKITLSSEHIDFKWCTLKESLELTGFQNTRQVMERASEHLQKKSE
ncbi:hypothetical protein Ahia01_001049100 [Argonauta hians]